MAAIQRGNEGFGNPLCIVVSYPPFNDRRRLPDLFLAFMVGAWMSAGDHRSMLGSDAGRVKA